MDIKKLKTPFGDIVILIDGKPVPYTARKGSIDEVLWPDIVNRFQIVVRFKPDNKKHTISCVFDSNCSFKSFPEGGERLECQSFYNDQRYKMSIGIECIAGYYCDGTRVSDEYDYDADYLENGMSYLIFPNTQTERYVFGIAWIDNVGWDDPIDDENDRDVETWFVADPSFRLYI